MKKWITNELGFLAMLCLFSCNRSTEAFVKTRTIGALLSIDRLGVQTTAWVISVVARAPRARRSVSASNRAFSMAAPAAAARATTTVSSDSVNSAPWRFSAYPQESRASLLRLWETTKRAAQMLDALPMEVLQSAFWSLDPKRTVAKFASFAGLEPGSSSARRFVTLEDWANEGEPLPYPAARELIEDLFDRDLPGSGAWQVGGKIMSDRIDCPLLNVTATADRITPAASAAAGESVQAGAGHVGMVVGSARARLHGALANFLG